MIIRANGRSIKFLRESGSNIVYCTLKSGIPCFNKERMMTKKEFAKFLKGPKGMRMSYQRDSVLGNPFIVWKKGRSVT